MSHRSHRFTQISSLQATVVTMPHSNRYFSARELRIFFRNTNCTNKLLSLERFVFNTQYYSFKSHTDLTDLTDFFRCKQRFVYHQNCVSTINEKFSGFDESRSHFKLLSNSNCDSVIFMRKLVCGKVYHFLYGIPYSSSSCLSKNEDYILPVSDCLLPKA